MEVCTAAIRPCTERVHPNSASSTEMDLENSAYSKWTNRLDFRISSSSRIMATRRIDSPIPSADNVKRQYNVRTHRGSVQIPIVQSSTLNTPSQRTAIELEHPLQRHHSGKEKRKSQQLCLLKRI